MDSGFGLGFLASHGPGQFFGTLGIENAAIPHGGTRPLRLSPVSLQQPSVPCSSLATTAGIVAAAAVVRRFLKRRPRHCGRTGRLQSQAVSTDGPVLTTQTGAPDATYTSFCDAAEPPESLRRRFEAICMEAQEEICRAIEDVDGKGKFNRDPYTRASSSSGGGVARVMTGGNVFEKAGINVSVVYGEMPQEALDAATSRGANRTGVKLAPGEKMPFFACGISSVMHPKNPHCPTLHFNYRYFETSTGIWWFGGGTDITPNYIDQDDLKHFHGTFKSVCDSHNPEWYQSFKEWADKYFYNPHRGETRGLGGIFFDDFNTESPEEHLQFAADCLKATARAYIPILEKNKHKQFTEQQKQWQQIRRGRYVEFNLVYDRGTVFGLKMLGTGVGRVESILMSLPETARWEYCHEPEPGSPEADIMDAFRKPREWC